MSAQTKPWLVCALCCVVVASGRAETSTLSFDDLSPGNGWLLATNGYGGLRWYYFAVLDGTLRPATEGYRMGVISSNNVAFNLSGEPATITSVTPFDLRSAYLTAAGPVDAHIEVQGYVGMRLTYVNTYTLSPTGPTLINFDYIGVDQVRFIPSSHSTIFVMDDLTIIPAASETPPGRPVDIGTVQVARIGHVFTRYTDDLSSGIVTDFLVSQRQTVDGGMTESFSPNADNNNQFTLKISAPAGQRFLIQPPSGQAVRFDGGLNWRTGAVPENDPSYPGTVVDVHFEDLEGSAPDFSACRSVLSLFHGFLGFNNIQSAPFSNVLAFTSMTLTATMPSRNIGLADWTYIPSGDNFLLLSYWIPKTNDPGSFVSIVPQEARQLAPPRLQIAYVGWNAAVYLLVYGQAGRTTVVERSGDLVHWTPISTNVMPATVCPTCPFVSVTDFFVDAVGQFYRASERP